MSWTPRTTAPTRGTTPYEWGASTEGQCTWYAYWRVQEGGYTPPCWQTGSGDTGSGKYADAKNWLLHWRNPWQVKDTSYSPVPGDIAVMTGTAGHCFVIETSPSGGTCWVSDYNRYNTESFSYYEWTIGSPNPYSGNTLLGYLHYYQEEPEPGEPSMDISPTSATLTIGKNESYVEVTYVVHMYNVPVGEGAGGGNVTEGLEETYSSGWQYSSYDVPRTATKTQTLRYTRVGRSAYTITLHNIYNKTFSTGSVYADSPLYITVDASGGGVMFLNPEIGSIEIR